jgi:hypothetical protein
MVRQPWPTGQLAPQNDQLMSEHRILSLKPALRLEWRGQDGQSETEQPDHSVSLGDSITASTQIRFRYTHVWRFANGTNQIKPRTSWFRGNAVALLGFPEVSRADEGGVSFWLPGQYGSLAAAPQVPGWALGVVYYHSNVAASGGVAASKEITAGGIPANVNVNLNLSLGKPIWPSSRRPTRSQRRCSADN